MSKPDKTMTLENILEPGMFAQNSDGAVFPTMVSMQEQLAAQYFAKEINEGRLSVSDAYRYFWSYEEDLELWGLPKDHEWRALLPSWRDSIHGIYKMLEKENREQLIGLIMRNERIINEQDIIKGRYSPFTDDYSFGQFLPFSTGNLRKYVKRPREITSYLSLIDHFYYISDKPYTHREAIGSREKDKMMLKYILDIIEMIKPGASESILIQENMEWERILDCMDESINFRKFAAEAYVQRSEESHYYTDIEEKISARRIADILNQPPLTRGDLWAIHEIHADLRPNGYIPQEYNKSEVS